MNITFSLSWTLGLALCTLAGGQLALWSASRLRGRERSKLAFKQQQQSLRQLISQQSGGHVASLNEQVQLGTTWRGFRDFVVDRLVKETSTTTSVYLVPADGKSIAHFFPGQHLTLRLAIPGLAKPIVRCYSLSDSPQPSHYRISVKEVPPPANRPELGFGKASHFINRLLQPGQTVEVKAPAGEFYLKEDSERLVVLLAGGVGITPMVSMLNRLADTQSQRFVLLVYGIRHGQDHPFKDHLVQLIDSRDNFYLINCYSQPQPSDQKGVDYQVHGNVKVELLQKVLKSPDAEFYLCGPPAFMKSIYDDLLAWGVTPEDIHFEAFGPASITTTSTPTSYVDAISANVVAHPITFERSGTTVNWNGSQSLLELAESHQVPVDSGCRAGSCGSCCVPILSGQVEYPAGQKPDCPAGHCLLCIARPKGGVHLDV